MFSQRLDRARTLMAEQQVDVLLLSVGADLPYFCGYEAMPLERLTMLVVASKRRRPAHRSPTGGPQGGGAARRVSRLWRGTRLMTPSI